MRIIHGDCGSSPHPWGIQKMTTYQNYTERFIPTSVGNTHWKCMGGRWRPVHPHIRGEYCTATMELGRRCGSSPHPWGILHGHPVGEQSRRFIPTSVGNTIVQKITEKKHTVHPHIRGEYVFDACSIESTAGSSPHPWGIPLESE